MEHLKLLVGTAPADALRLHDAGAKAFAARTSARPVPITTPEQFFELQRILGRQVADQMERVIATARAGG
jgi:hypothetical protein